MALDVPSLYLCILHSQHAGFWLLGDKIPFYQTMVLFITTEWKYVFLLKSKNHITICNAIAYMMKTNPKW